MPKVKGKADGSLVNKLSTTTSILNSKLKTRNLTAGKLPVVFV